MTHSALLREIGLNKTEVRCYVRLLEHGQATTRELAEQLKLLATNLYSTLNKLAEKGFIAKFSLGTHPVFFQARPLNEALQQNYLYQRRTVMPLFGELGLQPPPVLKIIK